MLDTVKKRLTRHKRIRARISGTIERPRLNVYRSNTSVYAQLIDDVAGRTLVSASDLALTAGSKSERAAEVGKMLGEKAKIAGITTVVFDRGGFMYTWRVKALADAAREAGLSF